MHDLRMLKAVFKKLQMGIQPGREVTAWLDLLRKRKGRSYENYRGS